MKYKLIGNFPTKLKKAIIKNHISTIILSVLGIIAIVLLNIFGAPKLDESLQQLILYASYAISGMLLIFFILLPLFYLLTGRNIKMIKNDMIDANLTYQELCYDFENNEKFNKFKIGQFFIFYHNALLYYALPTADIVIVKKRIKDRKTRKVKKYRNGAVADVKEVVSSIKTYYVELTTLHGKKIKIHCNSEKTADETVERFFHFKNVIKDADQLSKRKINARIKEIKNQRKEFKK